MRKCATLCFDPAPVLWEVLASLVTSYSWRIFDVSSNPKSQRGTGSVHKLFWVSISGILECAPRSARWKASAMSVCSPCNILILYYQAIIMPKNVPIAPMVHLLTFTNSLLYITVTSGNYTRLTQTEPFECINCSTLLYHTMPVFLFNLKI